MERLLLLPHCALSASEHDAAIERVLEDLKQMYTTKMLPLEMRHGFDRFYLPFLTDADFNSTSRLLQLTTFSGPTGTLTQYLLDSSFPCQLGPEIHEYRLTTVYLGAAYQGCFWDQPLVLYNHSSLVEADGKDFAKANVMDLRRYSVERIICELCNRVRLCLVHAYLIGHIQEQMPFLWGHAKKKAQLLDNLPIVFARVKKMYTLRFEDFPNLADFKAKLEKEDFSELHHLHIPMVANAASMLAHDIPRLLRALFIPRDDFSLDPVELPIAAERILAETLHGASTSVQNTAPDECS